MPFIKFIGRKNWISEYIEDESARVNLKCGNFSPFQLALVSVLFNSININLILNICSASYLKLTWKGKAVNIYRIHISALTFRWSYLSFCFLGNVLKTALGVEKLQNLFCAVHICLMVKRRVFCLFKCSPWK